MEDYMMRLQALDLAIKSQPRNLDDLMEIAQTFLKFIRGADWPHEKRNPSES